MPRERSRQNLDVSDSSEVQNLSCIDLTEDPDDSIIDLTNASVTASQEELSLDSSVVVLGTDTFVSPRRRRQIYRRNRRENNDVTVVIVNQTSPTVEISDVPSSSDSLRTDRVDDQAALNFDEVASPTPCGITCPICFESRSEISRSGKTLQVTLCGHVFCNMCIKGAVEIQKCCPTCRKRLTIKQIHPLFL